MNIVMIIPTGIGCTIGGHAGDANPVAKLLGSVCDNLILHPNVVNASDINEMPDNALYVEGSILDRFLEGEIKLKKVYRNKILLAVNSPLTVETINSVNAARVTIGADIEIVELNTPLEMIATTNEKAGGVVNGWEKLVLQVEHYNFDALAINTVIKVDKDIAEDYLKNGGINPWGGVEAIASRLIANALDKPVAHSPIDDKESEVYKLMVSLDEPVDPRMAAELVSVSYLHCILKGLHRAPRISHVPRGLHVNDIDFLISPTHCWGRPHIACEKANIPIIFVNGNAPCFKASIPNSTNHIFVNNYLEAVGVVQTYKSGVSIESITRPIETVKLYKHLKDKV